MIRGFYTAASGVYTQEKNLNNIANNISNSNTSGYKRDSLVMGTFGEHVTLRLNAYQEAQRTAIGPAVYMQVVDEKYTTYSQGGFEQTTRPLDMSIMGDGMFVIATADGDERLTRDGQFSLDEEGYLVLPGFGRVQGGNGDIYLGVSQIAVDATGNIYLENEDGEAELTDRLQIALPEDYSLLEKDRNGLYIGEDYPIATDEDPNWAVRQYHLERSNVNMADEMTRMIASQRALQSCSQIVKMYDDMAENINARVSRKG